MGQREVGTERLEEAVAGWNMCLISDRIRMTLERVGVARLVIMALDQGPLGVIRDRVEPVASLAMSAMPPKAEVNSEH